MSAWDSTRTPSLRKSASWSIIALRNNSESPILSSSATVHPPSVDWSLLKEPHGGRLRQQPLLFTHSRGHYPEVHIQDPEYPCPYTPRITPPSVPHSPAPLELVTPADRYARSWMFFLQTNVCSS